MATLVEDSCTSSKILASGEIEGTVQSMVNVDGPQKKMSYVAVVKKRIRQFFIELYHLWRVELIKPKPSILRVFTRPQSTLFMSTWTKWDKLGDFRCFYLRLQIRCNCVLYFVHFHFMTSLMWHLKIGAMYVFPK